MVRVIENWWLCFCFAKQSRVVPDSYENGQSGKVLRRDIKLTRKRLESTRQSRRSRKLRDFSVFSFSCVSLWVFRNFNTGFFYGPSITFPFSIWLVELWKPRSYWSLDDPTVEAKNILDDQRQIGIFILSMWFHLIFFLLHNCLSNVN